MVLSLHSAPNPIKSIRFSQLVPHFHSISISIWISTPLKGSTWHIGPFQHLSRISWFHSGFTRCRCSRRCRHHCCRCCQRRHPRLLPPRPRTASALPAAPGSKTAQLSVSVPVAASAALQTQAAGQRVARHQQVAQEVRHGVDPRVLAVVAQPVLSDPLVGGLGRLHRYHPRRSRRARPAAAARHAGSGQHTARRAAPSCLNSA